MEWLPTANNEFFQRPEPRAFAPAQRKGRLQLRTEAAQSGASLRKEVDESRFGRDADASGEAKTVRALLLLGSKVEPIDQIILSDLGKYVESLHAWASTRLTGGVKPRAVDPCGIVGRCALVLGERELRTRNSVRARFGQPVDSHSLMAGIHDNQSLTSRSQGGSESKLTHRNIKDRLSNPGPEWRGHRYQPDHCGPPSRGREHGKAESPPSYYSEKGEMGSGSSRGKRDGSPAIVTNGNKRPRHDEPGQFEGDPLRGMPSLRTGGASGHIPNHPPQKGQEGTSQERQTCPQGPQGCKTRQGGTNHWRKATTRRKVSTPQPVMSQTQKET